MSETIVKSNLQHFLLVQPLLAALCGASCVYWMILCLDLFHGWRHSTTNGTVSSINCNSMHCGLAILMTTCMPISIWTISTILFRTSILLFLIHKNDLDGLQQGCRIWRQIAERLALTWVESKASSANVTSTTSAAIPVAMHAQQSINTHSLNDMVDIMEKICKQYRQWHFVYTASTSSNPQGLHILDMLTRSIASIWQPLTA
jgi:hypothetical protein